MCNPSLLPRFSLVICINRKIKVSFKGMNQRIAPSSSPLLGIKDVLTLQKGDCLPSELHTGVLGDHGGTSDVRYAKRIRICPYILFI